MLTFLDKQPYQRKMAGSIPAASTIFFYYKCNDYMYVANMEG